MQPPPLAAGALIAGRYRLEEFLGQGGMGVVWAASHAITERAVALKFLRGPTHLQSQLRQRFLREARAASAVQHPNVVDVLDVFELDDHTPVMVMERLLGETLGQRLTRLKDQRRTAIAALLETTVPEGLAPKVEKPPRLPVLSLEVTAALFVPIVSAVAAAHARGIVHRDLKPDNVFIAIGEDTTERVKILDFGVAKLIDGGAAAGGTETGAVVGTPCYMAPEQALGEKTIDERVDVWALGVMLYECLAGVRPVEGDSVGQVVLRVTNQGIRSLKEVSEGLPLDLLELVDRMLRREREHRPSLGDVLAVLERHTAVRAPRFGAAGARPVSDAPARPPSESPAVDAHAPTERSRPQTAAGHELPTPAPTPPKRAALFRSGLVLALGAMGAALVVLARLPNASTDSRAAPSADAATMPATQPLRARMLTSLPADDPLVSFALSRDGKQYLYQTASGVWLADVQGGAPRRLKYVEEERALGTTFLADGRTLAIFRERASEPSPDSLELVLVPLGGGDVRLLPIPGVSRGVRLGTVQPSPDGREIAFASSGTVFAVDLASGIGRTITSHPSEDVISVDWSPDGSRLVFISGAFNLESQAQLRVVQADGRDDHLLLTDARLFSGRSGGTAIWLDERRIAFARLNDIQEGPGGGIWELELNGRIADTPRLLRRYDRQCPAELRWSRAAGRLVSLLSLTQGDVYVGELGPSAKELVRPSRLTLHESDDRPSAWLPDGRVLFMSDRYGTLDVLAQAPGNPDAELIAGSSKWETWPALLGDSIGYFSIDPAPARAPKRVELVRLDGPGRERRVLDLPLASLLVRETAPPPIDVQFSCARGTNPTCVLGQYEGGSFTLHRFDAKTGRVESPLYRRAASKVPVFDVAPDGHRIAMVGWEIDGLVLISIPTGEAREIKLESGEWQSVHWLPDESAVLLTGMDVRKHTYAIAHADLRGKLTLIHTSETSWLTQAIPSLDAKFLAFGAITYERNLELLEGF